MDRAKGSRMVQLLQASHTLSGCQGDLSAVRGGHSAATAAVPGTLLTMGLLVTMVGTAYTMMHGLALPHATWWPSAAVALAWFFVSATLAVTLAQRKRSRNRVRSR